MAMCHRVCFWFLAVCATLSSAQQSPVVNDDALAVSLFAAEPLIQTPIGAVVIVVDVCW